MFRAGSDVLTHREIRIAWKISMINAMAATFMRISKKESGQAAGAS
jgi:hypothetical protein